MKKLSRLTALLLALMMLVTSMPLGALADAVTIDVGTWNEWVSSAQQAATEQENETETVTITTTVTGTTDVVNRPVVEASLTAHAGTETSAAQSVSLPIAGKLVLHAYSGAASYQWQVKAGSQWANIMGDTGAAITLTYAKIQNAMSGSTAQVRCVMTVDGESYVSATAQVSVDESVTYTTVETQSTLTVTAEQPVLRTRAITAADAGIMLAAETPDTTKYTVQIQYVFADGKQAANPWTATVGAGSNLTQTVNSPSVLGYTPDQASVAVNVQNASEDTTYTVTYSAALVDYTVKHFQQNLNNDEYALKEEETREGYTESAVGDNLAKSYKGFYSLLYDTTTPIAADGSTEIEIKYDRYYYLMNFDLDGGYGVEPIYARYGAAIGDVGTPTKPDYEFLGWVDETGNAVTVPSMMPDKNVTYKAIWSAGNTTFNVVFWYENANDNGYSVAGSYGPITATAGTTVVSGTYANQNFEDRDSEHFTYNAAKAESKVVSGDGSTTLNVYYTRNLYVVDFVATGLCGIENHTHSDECQGLICVLGEHTHSDGCDKEIVCALTEHTHTSACMKCGKEEHNHGVSCCSLTEHTHNSACCNNGDMGHKFMVHGVGALLGAEFLDWAGCTADHVDHTHGDGNCNTSGCGQENHVHDESCYKDVEHTHNDGCYVYKCNQQEHEHISTCYATCSIPEHTCSSNCKDATKTNVVKRVIAKYDSDISSVWETDPIKGYLDDGYVFKSSLTSKYYSYLEKMPGTNITMTATQWEGNKYTWYYYLEVLPGQDTTGMTTRTDNGKTYYLYHTTSVYGNNISLTYEEDYFPITGFTQRDSSVPSFSSRTAYLYYVRNQYELKFMNYGAEVTDRTENVYYQANISNRNFTPSYPTTLEAGAYEFGGWYTTEECYEGTEFVFENATMPAGPVILYAKWVPVTHTVSFYLDYNEYDDGKGTSSITATHPQQQVKHGELAKTVEDPTNGSYTFVGWFYMDNGTEKAFDFANMPVTKVLQVYGKWSSNTLMEYTIHYTLEDGTPVAPDTTGSALAGDTKTFPAKAGDELNEAYQVGYFPKTNSHSLIIDIEDPSKNVFTFIYVPKEALPYTVMYLEYDGNYVYDGTESVLHEPKRGETREAVMTENFEPIAGYMPDAYQKRLVLSADESQNVIIFWYVKDDVHAPVHIIHYIQNAEGEDYTIYQEYTDLNGVIDQKYSADVLTITGFDFDHATANKTNVANEDGKVTGTVIKSGLLLELYYNRELHPYEFKFLEQGTDKVLADSVTGTARYGAQVTQNYKDLESNGYELVTEQAQAITIQVEDGGTAVKNVRIFYYVEKEATINYRIVDPDNHVFDENQSCGSLTSFQDESIKVLTGTATGSTATRASNVYKFVGWYNNAECSGNPISTDATYVPTKQEGGVWVDGTTYYAKFEDNLTTLTIEKAGSVESNETFIFNVTSGKQTFRVAITGNGSKVIGGLTVGDTVTVTEETGWSNRYTPNYSASEITLVADPANEGKNKFVITNGSKKDKWLYDEAVVHNNFNTAQ